MKKMFRIIVSITLVLCLTSCGKPAAIANKDESNLQSSSNNEDAKLTGDENKEPNNKSPIYSIKIDGEEYTFPMSYKELKSYGWTYHLPEDDDVSQWSTTVQPKTTFDVDYDKDDIKWLEFLFYNNTTEEVTLDKCQIIGFRLEYDRTILGEDGQNYINIPNGSIVFNEELSIGESTSESLSDCFETGLGAGNEIGMISTEDMTMTFEFDENGIFHEVFYNNTALQK